MSKPIILVAENIAAFLSLIVKFLERHGYRVIAVDNPGDARRVLAQQSVAAAVLDVRLVDDDDERDMSGLDVARYATDGGAVPKIILTGFEQYEAVRAALRSWPGQTAIAVDVVIKREGLAALLEPLQRVILKARVFLCYAREDEQRVKELYQKLVDAGFDPWMDRKNLLGGEQWERAIRTAIRDADFFVVCLSNCSTRKRGPIQKEIAWALDRWMEKLEDDIYLIPARLESCKLPERLSHLHWVDLFRPNGFARLVQALRAGIERRL